MSSKLNVYLSNSLDIHYQQLKMELFGSGRSPFQKRLIVVYGPAMQSWLMLKMAQDPELGVAMGIEFVYLNQAYEELLKRGGHFDLHNPSALELALAIEKELHHILTNFERLNSVEQQEWSFLLQYLNLKASQVNTPLSSKMEKRIVGLSLHLAALFRDYGRYGAPLLDLWEKEATGSWQAILWNRLFNSSTGWTSQAKAMESSLNFLDHYSIHFFSISFTSKQEFEFLKRLSLQMTVNYYLLSPCALFWSDIRSDKESSRLSTFWQKKGKDSSDEILQLEEILRDRNPLLANFGRLGREMATQIELSDAETISLYCLPSSVGEIDDELLFDHEDLFFEETDMPLSLLKAIQSDMLLLRNPEGGDVCHLQPTDRSIQLHQTPSRRREVQILYNNLLAIIEKNPDIHPSDIIVMAPQIADYVPYIRSQFGSAQSQIDFQLMDLGMQNHNEIVQGFLQLIALSESRWDVNHLLQLFENRAFQRRHQITLTDYHMIRKWIEKAGIYWGEDSSHREELLKKRHCQEGMAETTRIGTWDFGLTRLMFGLTTLLEEGQVDNLPLGVLPCDSVDFSNCDLLNKWIGLIHSLRDDISPLADGTKLTMKDWAHYLSCLLESYFKPDYDLAESVNDYADLNGQFAILRSAAKSFEETLYPFYSVKTHLDDLLKNRGITYRENHLQAVRFCSMLPLRSIPAKVIAILGLEEGAFPRQNQYSSLNRMLDVKECDYCPLATDLDRYLFLEAIHSAQEFLLLSYQGYSIKDQKELQPSLLVGELYAYLDKYYSLAGKSVSEACLFKHPFNSFDKKYFEQDSVLPNFSVACYASAKICDDLDKVPSHAYLRQFEVGVSQLQEEQEATPIDLKLLSAIARNPIKFHLNRGMDIYLQDPEDRMVKNEEDLVLSPLAKYQMRETAVTTPIELILNRAEQAGQMPFGMFKEVAAQKMKVEKDLLTNAFKKHQIKESDIFQIEFRQGCKSPMQLREDLWILPAPLIHVDGTSRTIVGKLPLVAPQGLIVANKGAVEEIWKIWPQFLLYQMASKSLPFSLEPQVIALHTAKPKKSFFDDPTPYLQAFISYYDMCHKQVSPFMPEWISFIFKQDAVGLQKKMMEEPFKKGRRTEVDFVLNKKELPNVEEIIHNWKPRLDLLAGDFFSAWYPARSKELVEE